MDEVCSFEPCAGPGQGHLLGHELLGSLASKTLALCSYFGVLSESDGSSLACRIHMQYYVVLIVAHGDHCQVSKCFLCPSFREDHPLGEVFLR